MATIGEKGVLRRADRAFARAYARLKPGMRVWLDGTTDGSGRLVEVIMSVVLGSRVVRFSVGPSGEVRAVRYWLGRTVHVDDRLTRPVINQFHRLIFG